MPRRWWTSVPRKGPESVRGDRHERHRVLERFDAVQMQRGFAADQQCRGHSLGSLLLRKSLQRSRLGDSDVRRSKSFAKNQHPSHRMLQALVRWYSELLTWAPICRTVSKRERTPGSSRRSASLFLRRCSRDPGCTKNLHEGRRLTALNPRGNCPTETPILDRV